MTSLCIWLGLVAYWHTWLGVWGRIGGALLGCLVVLWSCG
jgi:hypothetical protein